MPHRKLALAANQAWQQSPQLALPFAKNAKEMKRVTQNCNQLPNSSAQAIAKSRIPTLKKKRAKNRKITKVIDYVRTKLRATMLNQSANKAT